nr:hypothetical protein K-LCC10_0080 [Kaumoebavirus]
MSVNITMQHYKPKLAPEGIYFEGPFDFCVKCKGSDGEYSLCQKCIGEDKKYYMAKMFKRCYICRKDAYFTYFCDPCLRYNTIYYENGDWIKPEERVHPIPNIRAVTTWVRQLLKRGSAFLTRANGGTRYYGIWNHQDRIRYDPDVVAAYPKEFEKIPPAGFPDIFVDEDEEETKDLEDKEAPEYPAALTIVSPDNDIIAQLIKHGVEIDS